MRVVAPLVLGLCALSAQALVLRHEARVEGPMEKIVKMLTLTKTKMESDLTTTEQHNDKYGCWFKNYKDTNTEAMEKLSENIETLEGENKDEAGKMAALTATLKNANNELTELEHNMETNKARRADEKSDHDTNVANLKNTDSQCGKALQALGGMNKAIADQIDEQDEGKQTGNFLAVAANRELVTDVLLQARKTPLSDDDKTAVGAWLQSAKVGRYQQRSGKIIGIIKNMQDAAQQDRKEAENEEREAADAYSTQHTNNQREASRLRTLIKDTDEDLSAAQTKSAEGEAQYLADKQERSERQKNLDDATAEFKQHQFDFSEHVKLASGEITAVGKAIEILTSAEAKGVSKQTATRNQLFMLLQTEMETPVEAFSILKAAARKSHSIRLALVASKVAMATQGHFDKVIEAIDEMVVQLREEMDEDVKNRDQCETDDANMDARHATNEARHKKAESNIAALQSKMDGLDADMDANAKDQDRVNTEFQEALDGRNQDRVEFKKQRANDAKAVDIINQAIEVISAYYRDMQKEGRFLQLADDPAGKYTIDENDSHKRDIKKYKGGAMTKGVVGLMEKMRDDILLTMKNDLGEEKEAIAAFSQFKKDTENTIDGLVSAKNDMTGAKANAGKNQAAQQEAKELAQGVMDEVAEMRKSWHTACDWVKDSFEKRRANRLTEIEALEHGKKVLSGGGNLADRNAASVKDL